MRLTLNLLLVDDDNSILQVHKLALEEKGYTCASVRNATDAIAYLSVDPFDGVLLDHKMPGTTGLEILRKLKVEGISIPVIIVSGASFVQKNKELFTGAGALAILDKPADYDEIDRLLKNAPRTNLEETTDSQ